MEEQLWFECQSYYPAYVFTITSSSYCKSEVFGWQEELLVVSKLMVRKTDIKSNEYLHLRSLHLKCWKMVRNSLEKTKQSSILLFPLHCGSGKCLGSLYVLVLYIHPDPGNGFLVEDATMKCLRFEAVRKKGGHNSQRDFTFAKAGGTREIGAAARFHISPAFRCHMISFAGLPSDPGPDHFITKILIFLWKYCTKPTNKFQLKKIYKQLAAKILVQINSNNSTPVRISQPVISYLLSRALRV